MPRQPARTVRCTACDFENRDDARFCEECGAPLGGACPACGAAVPGGRKFCGACGAPLDATGSAAPAPRDEALAAWARQPGDRRPVTLLFADITGSTALTERLDPEATHDLIYGAVQRLCESVESNRGTVCRFMGDGVMAVFGAPHANENHALDACRAALDMQSAVGAYGAGLAGADGNELRIRVGLHSGEVVVLRVGEGEEAGVDASGPSVPIAARMEQAAEPGTILMTGATRALAGARARAVARPPVRVKGVSEPIPVYVLESVRDPTETPSEEQARFVGRRAELAQLGSLLDPVRDGSGQMAHVRGEAGIGKTRLVQELMDRAAAAGFACHKGLVLDFGTGKGRDAVRTLVRGLIGLRAGADKADRAAELDGAVARGLVDADDRVFATDLLDLPQAVELRALYDAMSNAERLRGKRRVVAELVRRASRARPRLLVVEDLHWADPVTLDQVAGIAEVVHRCPALLVTTAREEDDPVDPTWRMRVRDTALTVIELGALRREESALLVEALLGADEGLATGCIERAAGNPLFLEQLVRNAAENTGDGLPDTIQTLVMARMDRLERGDREALQAAAVLGQRFDTEALRALTGTGDYDASPLVAHHLLRPEGDGYLFAHALVRDGVYASLLRATRRDLHRRAAEWFADGDPGLRAEHLAEAEDPRAPGAFLEAARAQRAAYRYGRARELAERGLALATERADRAALQQLAARVLLDLGDADAAIEAGASALALAGDDAERCRARLGIASAMRVVERLDEAFEALDAAESEALRADLPLELSRIHHLRGNLHFPRGEFEACRAAHERALDAARRARSVEAEAQALGGLGDAAYAQGRARTAVRYFEDCVALCRRHGFGRVEVANRSMIGFAGMYLNELRAGAHESRATIEAARRVGHGRAELLGEILGLVIAIETGDDESVLGHAARTLDLAERLGARRFRAQALFARALVLAQRGQSDGAEAAIDEAVEVCRATGMQFMGPRALAIAALVLESPERRRAALAEGERVLAAGAVGHSHLLFYRDAMNACLDLRDYAAVERYAAALEAYTREEPLPWADFFIARARALVAHARGANDDPLRQTLWHLREEATAVGLGAARPAIERALES